MIIFTHYPDKPDEEDLKKYELYKKEINEELNKNFEIPSEFKIPDIPVYFVNTKIFKKDGVKYYDENSQNAIIDFIEELKLRIHSPTYSPIDTTDLDCDKNTIVKKIEDEKNMILKEIEELKKDKEKREKLRRDLELEEQRYRELENHRRSSNRDSVGIGIIGFGVTLLGAVASSCTIF